MSRQDTFGNVEHPLSWSLFDRPVTGIQGLVHPTDPDLSVVLDPILDQIDGIFDYFGDEDDSRDGYDGRVDTEFTERDLPGHIQELVS